MRALSRLAAVLFCALPVASPAQNLKFDAALGYSARDEVTNEGDEEAIDNDIFRLTTGLTWDAGVDGKMRGALEFGVGNEDFNGNYPGFGGAELVFSRKVGLQRYSLGGRVRSAEDLSTTSELAYVLEHLGAQFGLRGVLGIQNVADPDEVRGRDGSSIFGQAEASYYFTDNFVLSAGLIADNDGEAFGGGVEFRPSSTGPFSFFLEYGEAFDEYRDVASYDEFTGGIRFYPGTSSLRDARQNGLSRVLQRYLEVQ